MINYSSINCWKDFFPYWTVLAPLLKVSTPYALCSCVSTLWSVCMPEPCWLDCFSFMLSFEVRLCISNNLIHSQQFSPVQSTLWFRISFCGKACWNPERNQLKSIDKIVENILTILSFDSLTQCTSPFIEFSVICS
jgi:hypothetical protein